MNVSVHMCVRAHGYECVSVGVFVCTSVHVGWEWGAQALSWVNDGPFCRQWFLFKPPSGWCCESH